MSGFGCQGKALRNPNSSCETTSLLPPKQGIQIVLVVVLVLVLETERLKSFEDEHEHEDEDETANEFVEN
ncbi:hypothetical protein D1AOALGA4SA_1652 [Olavius algarvensis Delta 1 endosymbiont]|nr:hypothetical protein D1AOALGA4SA_1652 [Olavius algarvensis Delta 1 endosymbiont]